MKEEDNQELKLFSEEAKEVIENARRLAYEYDSKFIIGAHILESILEMYTAGGKASTSLEDYEVYEILGAAQSRALMSDIKMALSSDLLKRDFWKTKTAGIQMHPETERVLEQATVEARISGSGKVTVRHILQALTKEKPDRTLLGNYGITYSTFVKESESMKNPFRSALGGDYTPSAQENSNTNPIDSFFGADSDFPDESPIKKSNSTKTKTDTDMPFLDQFSFDMTKAAKEGKFDPVVGREKELEQLLEILSCRKKNNAILLGDPGVGKTAVVEALAQRIVSLNVPKYFLDKKICSLDLNGLVSGTKYRGQYEERLQGIIKEVTSHPEIIVYIDEFHNLVGNGSSSGSGDGANILKPYLARGEFQCIGSTTVEEYRKYVEKDGALKRRFQNIMVDQPDASETETILENIKGKYEEFHGITVDQEIVKKCVEWTGRYVTDRFFPDKAIDALDMTASRTKLAVPTDTEKLKEAMRELEEAKAKKKEAVKSQNFELAADWRDKEKELERKVSDLKGDKEDVELEGEVPEKPAATLDTLESVISKLSGIPEETIGKTDVEKLKGMKTTLEREVIGQPQAIKEVVMSLQRNSLGLRDPKKPIASLLMVGPTGSGKTYLCKTLAREFFGSEDALIRFDMSEFTEKHEVTKLTGATASYVGYEDTPLLDQVRRKPYSVVLFDEIEKADKAIYQVFLSILDEGFIALGNGVKVDFKNTVIVFTGNVGTKELMLHGDGLGFGKPKTKEEMASEVEGIIMKSIRKTFSPEFINRLSKTIVFNNLDKADMAKICDLELKKLEGRLAERGYSLTVSPEVKSLIVDSCDLKYGARDLQRGIVKYVEEEICTQMLEETDTEGKNKITVALKKKSDPDSGVKVKFA
jgi:ATP-dependent Clp protease ATP-binding subunit ClpC